MKHVVIYREPDTYCSFPHVVRLSNGVLAVVFRRAGKFSADAAKNGVATHHDPDSSIQLITSPDLGHTWPAENRRTVYKGRWGVNDPAMTVLADGSVICRFVALDIRQTSAVGGEPPKKIFSHRTEHGLVTSVVGNMIMRSTEYGESWVEIGVEQVPELGGSCSRDPIVEMPDGSWLAPVYTGAPQRSDISWVVRSFDRGRTWCEPVRVAIDDNGRYSELQGINYNETSLISLGRGELLAMIRADETYHTSGDEFMPVGMVGTLVTALIAMVIGVPISFGIAFFLTEVAPRWLRGPVGTAIELLAGIPSIIYGMWGLFVLVPVMTEHVTPWLNDNLGTIPGIGVFFRGPPLGIGMLTAGFVLAIMIIPFISSVMREVFLTVPTRLKESAYALGSTKWEVSWDIVLPYTRSAVIGGIFLGLGRALGETMAVAFVIGNTVKLSASLLEPGTTIAALIANDFGEATETYRSALLLLGFVLFIVTFIVLAIARYMLMQLSRKEGN